MKRIFYSMLSAIQGLIWLVALVATCVILSPFVILSVLIGFVAGLSSKRHEVNDK